MGDLFAGVTAASYTAGSNGYWTAGTSAPSGQFFANAENVQPGVAGNAGPIPNDTYGGPATFKSWIECDLGAARAMTSMYFTGDVNNTATYNFKIYASASPMPAIDPARTYTGAPYPDPVSQLWTEITGTWTPDVDWASGTTKTLTPASPTAAFRYWALLVEHTTTGNTTRGGQVVSEWGGVAAVVPDPVPGAVIDFANDGFDVGTYDNVTADVMAWTITRGASAEITGGTNPGSASILLRRTSRDGRYNPRNASGPLYGLLRDGLRVHIAINDDGTISGAGTLEGLFAGRVTDITVLPDSGPSHAVVTEFACEDPLAWYQRTPVHVSDAIGRSYRELRLAVLDAIGETRYSLDNEIATMPISAADGDGLSVLGQINAANGTRHFAKPVAAASSWYQYTTYNRQHKLAGVADATLSAASDYVTDTSGWRLSADTVINQQRASVDPITFLHHVVWTHDALPLIVVGTVVLWATFPDFVSAATIDYDYSGTAPTVTLTSFGRTAKITLVSAGSTTFSKLQISGDETVRGDPQSYVADDTTSQATARGIRAGSEISGDYVGVLASARGIAEHVVWRYGSPQMRPTLTVHNWFPEQFQLDLFDVIAFTSGNLGSVAVLFEIVGLTHVADIASATVKHHVTTYVLQECRVQTATSWFTVESSALNGAHITGY